MKFNELNQRDMPGLGDMPMKWDPAEDSVDEIIDKMPDAFDYLAEKIKDDCYLYNLRPSDILAWWNHKIIKISTKNGLMDEVKKIHNAYVAEIDHCPECGGNLSNGQCHNHGRHE